MGTRANSPKVRVTTPEFGLADAAYRAFRPRYPAALFDAILAAVGPGRDLVIDLGAGTGLSTAPLSAHFTQVIAVEPDAAMARALAGLASNIEADPSSAEDFSAEPESADLVTAGNCFYWFDGPAVAARIARWLKPGAPFAAYRYDLPMLHGQAAEIVGREYHGPWDPYRHERLRDVEYTVRTLRAAAGFAEVSLHHVPHARVLTPREVAGFFASSSFASAYARDIGDADYFTKLADELEAACGPTIETDSSVELVLARKGV